MILVTGATGFIGRFLVECLLEDSHPVRVYVRNKEKAKQLFAKEVEIFEGDINDPISIQAALKNIDFVMCVC